MNEPDQRTGAAQPGSTEGRPEPQVAGAPTQATQQHLPGSPVASTGDAQVDAALSALQGLDELPAEEQADVIEAVHDELRDTLGTLGGASESGNAAGAEDSD